MTSEDLIAKHPQLFANGNTLEIGDGWLPLVDKLCQLITIHCQYTGDTVPVTSQIKEKFGALRFYVNQASDEVYEFIDRTEQLSAHICEVCGAPGEISGKHWLKAACPEHTK